MARKLTIRTHGSFRIIDADGSDLTPPLAKAQGLILLLLTAADGTRGRAWVQDRLWSDRGPEQGAASLRQTLSVIRRCLGPHREILQADRRRISLDLARLMLEAPEDRDLAEGLDIRDPEFDAWLTQERARQPRDMPSQRPHALPATPADPAPSEDAGEAVTLVCRGDGSEITEWSAQALGDALFRSLSENARSDVRRIRHGVGAESNPGGLVLELDCLRAGDSQMVFRLAVFDGLSRRQIWADRAQASLRSGPPVDDIDVLRLTNQAIDAIVMDRRKTRRARADKTPDSLLRLALNKIFTMQSDEVAEADGLLALAYDLQPSPLYLAWRLQIRTIQRLERHVQDERILREEGRAFAAHALEADGANSMVLALAANASLFLFRDPQASMTFARASLERNPANAMAVWASSSASLYNGDLKGAYRDAIRGRRIAGPSRRQFFWDLQHGATAMVMGRHDEAVSLFRGISWARPHFRPPLRYLIALDASFGRSEQAVGFAERLKAIEPDFSMQRMLTDPDYPASLVHRTQLIDPARISDII